MHPACRVRREGFGLLFSDLRGPRLLFAETGDLIPVDFFDAPRGTDEFPAGVTERQKPMLRTLFARLITKGFLREQ